MNERFRELAEQAVEQVCSKRTLSDGQIERVWHPDQFNQVFAELIVRECMAMCKTTVGNADYNTGRLHCLNNIKEHFGVK
jgi:hypothetical protein